MAKVRSGSRRIWLVGLMGSGKTTVGKLLAEALGRPFVDLDDLIVARTRQSISEVFAQHGEFNFRACEAHVLRDVPRRYPEAVVATGGGAPAHFDGMRFINHNGLSVFLDVSPAHVVSRLADQRDARPLLARDDWEDIIADMARDRRAAYEQAHVSVGVDASSPAEVAGAIAAQLPQIEGH